MKVKKSKNIQVLFLIPDNPVTAVSPSARFRAYQYAPFLEKLGITCVYSSSRPAKYFMEKPSFKSFTKIRWIVIPIGLLAMCCWRFFDVLKSKNYNAVFIQKPLFPGRLFPFFEILFSYVNKKLIFDFDDAIFLRRKPTKKLQWLELLSDRRDCERIIKACSHVIAGNSYLARYAWKFNPNVSIIPTPIDIEKFKPKKSKKNKGLTIGWIGTNKNLIYIKNIQQPLQNLKEKFSFTFKIICNPPEKPFQLNGVPSVFKAWNINDEISEIQNFDIGIMPLTDDPWTRGKCSFKALQYMACGIPCVCSPVEMNKEVIKDGENGFLADTQREWEEKLTILLKNPDLRKKIGDNARKTVEKYYSIQICTKKLADIIYKVASSKEKRT